MYKECRTDRSRKRQKLICDTLLERMRTQSYDDITVTELCDSMGVPRKAFYRYFDDKDSVLDCIVNLALREFPTSGPTPPFPRYLHRELEGVFNFWLGKRDLMEVLDKNGKLGKIMDVALQFPVEDIIEMNRLLPGENAKMRKKITHFAITGIISIIIDWYREGFESPVNEIARIAVRILTKPLLPALALLGMVDV